MRDRIALCITRLTQTYMAKHLICHNTLDRLNEGDETNLKPLPIATADKLQKMFNNNINNLLPNINLIIGDTIDIINNFLIDNNYADDWDVEADDDFINDLKVVLTTNDMIMNCENCRMLMGKCEIIDKGMMDVG